LFFALAACIAASMILASVPLLTKATATYGPRVDELLCKIYADQTAEWNALTSSDIDLTDCQKPVGIEPWDNNTLDPYREIGMIEFDLNNNGTMLSYPNIKSPTSDVNFRHAIAHLVDKDFIISTYLGGYGARLESPIMPWLRWYDPTITTHPYSPATACQILYDNGWRDSSDPDVLTAVHFPPGWPAVNGGPNVAGQTLASVLINGPHLSSDAGLIFYATSGHPERDAAAHLLIYGDATHKGLESVGIPVDEVISRRIPVTTQKDFHLYTGGWGLIRDPDYLYDVWGSQAMNWDTDVFAFNYDNIHDPIWDNLTAATKFADNLDAAETACHQALQRFSQQVFFIPLWTNVGYMGHGKAWHVLNVDSYSVKDPWNLYCMNKPSIGVTGGQLKWGFWSDVEQLNVIYSSWQWDWQVLDEIYGSLIVFNPLNIGVDMPWMASSWTIGTWNNPNTGRLASRISFTLKEGIKWVNPVSGTEAGSLTPEDVRFTAQCVYDHNGWNKNLVADLFVNPDGLLKIEISGNTITFYESQKSAWALHWIGSLPIIPKSVFQNIVDPTGFYPGGSDLSTLVGSGAFYFASYDQGVSCLLKANRMFHKTIAPNMDTDPTHIKLDWGIFKSNAKSGDWRVNVLDLIIVASAVGWTGRPGDIPGDINKDGKVNVLDLIIVATCIGADWDW
jgi:ABC-type transport system substrate-binding protein